MSESSAGTASGTEHLTDSECWSLLSKAEVGRLGVAALGTVEIVPINFVVDQKRIVFRTAPGAKLVALTLENSVALEIDGWDDAMAWSVLVKGTAEALRTDAEIRAASHANLNTWAPDPKSTYVLIRPTEVTGRRFARNQRKPESTWHW